MNKGYEMRNNGVNSFWDSGYKNVDVKFLFDSLRNVGICGAIAIGGIELGTNRSGWLENLNSNAEIGGITLVVISFILLILNFLQFAEVLKNSGGSFYLKTAYAILLVVIYLVFLFLYFSLIFSVFDT